MFFRNYPSITTELKELGETKGIVKNDMPFLIAYSKELLSFTRVEAYNETTVIYEENFQMHNCSNEEYKLFFNSAPINDSLIYICGNVKNLVAAYGINKVYLYKCEDLDSNIDDSCNFNINETKIYHVEFFVKYPKFTFSEENFQIHNETIHYSRDSYYDDWPYGYFPFKHTIINVDKNILISDFTQTNISNIYFPYIDFGDSGLELEFTYHDEIIGEYTFVYAKLLDLITQVMTTLFFCSLVLKLFNKEIGMFLYLKSFLLSFLERSNEHVLEKILGRKIKRNSEKRECANSIIRIFNFKNYILSKYFFFAYKLFISQEIEKFMMLETKLKKFISMKRFLFNSFGQKDSYEIVQSLGIEMANIIESKRTESARNETSPIFPEK